MNKVFIPKTDPEIPDFYTVTFVPVNGAKEYDLKIVQHQLIANNKILLVVTTDDTVQWKVVENFLSIDFDKDHTKILEIRNKKKEDIQTTGS